MKNRTLLAQLVATAIASTAVVGAAQAATPFASETLSQGYMVVAQADVAKPVEKPAQGKGASKKEKEGKCGEGKCGEGKCGEGKCGSKAHEGKADDKAAPADAPKPAY